MRVDDPEPPEVRATLVGLRDVVRPDGETVGESETVPEKLLRLVRLMVEFPDEPV